MTYAMSDIHGCYDKYLKMLKEIEFNDDDTLYVLGDVIDRGPKPIELLTDMSMRANVFPILGNHEYMAFGILKRLIVLLQEITDESVEELENSNIDLIEFTEDVELWRAKKMGGGPTMQGFRELLHDDREFLIEYLEEFSLFEAIEVGGRNYVLSHCGIPNGATSENLDSFDAWDFITAKVDYGRQYFKDAYLVTGHIPTKVIDKSYKGRIYRNSNNIAIDTGAVFGEKLACLCLDTDEEFYV